MQILDFTPALLVWSASCATLVVEDSRTKRLSNSTIARGLLASWLLLISSAIGGASWQNLVVAAALTLALAALFLMIALLARGGFGMGDVKFAPLAYLIPSLMGWQQTFLAVLLSFAAATLFGSGRLLLRKGNLKSKVPFGPFMFIGSLIIIFAV